MPVIGAAARKRAESWESRLVRLAPDAGEAGADALIQFERDVHDGLSRAPKSLPSLYFYDARGSELFRRIMDLPEYYLTRAERDILERHGGDIAAPFAGRPCDVVDLGAGDGAKTRILLGHLARANGSVRYVPIDVSDGALATVLDACAAEMPSLSTQGVVAEYEAGIRWLSRSSAERSRLV